MFQVNATLPSRLIVALGAFALIAGVALSASNAPAQATTTTRYASTTLKAVGSPDKSGKNWSGVVSFSFPQNSTAQFLHADCPASFPIVVNGAYAFNNTGQLTALSVGFNGPRIDESQPDYNEWGWEFYDPAGFPAGLSANFAIFCTKA